MTLPKEGQARFVLGFPEYPGGMRREFVGNLAVNSVPAKAAVFQTPDDREKVLDFYIRWLAQQKFFPARAHRFGSGSAYVSYYDSVERTIRVVTMLPGSGGGTLVVFSSMDPRPLLKKQPVVPPMLPEFSDISGLSTTEAESQEGASQSTHFVLSGVNEDEARRKVQEQMEARGWKRVFDSNSGDRRMFFEKEQARCTVTVNSGVGKDGGTSASVTMVVSPR